jgi:Tfp pilus assembly pilus retraction ATPase PilT
MKLSTVMQTGRGKGMISMDDCLLGMISDGKITQEAAYMKALDKSRFK